MNLSDLIGPIPKECKGKYSSHARTQTDFAEMFPLLSQEELFYLTEEVSNTTPSTYHRQRVIEHYTNINYSRGNVC